VLDHPSRVRRWTLGRLRERDSPPGDSGRGYRVPDFPEGQGSLEEPRSPGRPAPGASGSTSSSGTALLLDGARPVGSSRGSPTT